MLQAKSFLSSYVSLSLALSVLHSHILISLYGRYTRICQKELYALHSPLSHSYIRPPLEYAYECIFTKRNQGPVTDVQNVPIRLVIGLGCWLAGLLSTLNWPSDSGHFVPCTGAPPLYVQIYTHPWNPLLPLGFLIAPPPLANRTESERGEALRPFGFLTDHVSLR